MNPDTVEMWRMIASKDEVIRQLSSLIEDYEQYGTPDGYASALQSSMDNFNRAKNAERKLKDIEDAWFNTNNTDELIDKLEKILGSC